MKIFSKKSQIQFFFLIFIGLAFVAEHSCSARRENLNEIGKHFENYFSKNLIATSKDINTLFDHLTMRKIAHRRLDRYSSSTIKGPSLTTKISKLKATSTKHFREIKMCLQKVWH